MSDSNQSALIFGVTGQDGRYLAELLVRKGQRVTGTSRSNAVAEPLPAGVALQQLDLDDAAAVARLVRDLAPSSIYHLAGQTSVGRSFAEPAATFRSIAVSTLNVLEAVRALTARPRTFVAGSGEVFGDTGGEPARETTPFRPSNPYAAAKVAATELVRTYRAAYGLHASVGLLFNHESPRRPEAFVTRKIVRGACEIALGRRAQLELGELGVVRDWGWAPEYVEAMVAMVERHAPDDFVIATGTSHPLQYFVDEVFHAVGLDPRKHVVSNPAFFRPTEIRVLRADPSRAAAELGWRATKTLRDVARLLVDAELKALGAPPR